MSASEVRVLYGGTIFLCVPASLTRPGFVYSDIPSPKTAQTVFKLFTKRANSSRKLPSLFHRSHDGPLGLSISEAGLTLLADGSRYMHVAVSKVYFAQCIQRTMLVFTRRSSASKRHDDSSSFKCHVLTLENPDEAEAATAHMMRLISTLGFRRQSMTMVSRPASIASLDSLFDPASLPASAASSAVSSAVQSAENSGDEDAPEDRDIKPLLDAQKLQWRLERGVQSAKQPCGVCKSGSGSNWIALKSCNHQFHLSCIADWRWSHNLCPTCAVPISRSSATLRFLGSCFVEGELPSDEELYATAYDNKTATTMYVLILTLPRWSHTCQEGLRSPAGLGG